MVDTSQPPGAAVHISGLPERGRVLCEGFIESVTYAPATQVAAFTAIVTDHDRPGRTRPAEPAPAESSQAPAGAGRNRPSSGRRNRLRVIWLGRRRIPGIDAGTELRLEGMLTVRDGLPTIFNPRYEILSHQENQ
ncbi:hypothetical protein B1A87_010130 [Arthrobacter sp. KBS0703]|uniref:hypothetical protein n=1 Tax=Arthrobacter sp. KBS0703 TaxID=1955698 RepID=UPI00098F24A8|nr:hypothetical protein [Arthrobacter sp. KBS0703]TSE16174.1 hypothetical protein B1A87_010130 [Arthrobacter sp. KBS0703]